MRGSKTVNLALQGGGAHGAFTWGVLDRLAEEERLQIEGISATSAGAMNAAAFKAGLIRGGRDGAKAALDDFWTHLTSFAPAPSAIQSWLTMFAPSPALYSNLAEANPAYLAGDVLSRFWSPSQLNPLNHNPMRAMVERMFDAECVSRQDGPALFISATNVRTGRIKVFEGAEITVDAILASACIPTLYQAVEITDAKTGKTESYWDGGYSGNPALFPLFYKTRSTDIIIVHINPIRRDEVPDSAQEILNRENEISFNASLLAEFRAIAFVQRLIDTGAVAKGSMKYLHIHSIRDETLMNSLGAATKLAPEPAFLQQLKEAGRAAAHKFLREHWKDLGERGIDLRRVMSA